MLFECEICTTRWRPAPWAWSDHDKALRTGKVGILKARKSTHSSIFGPDFCFMRQDACCKSRPRAESQSLYSCFGYLGRRRLRSFASIWKHHCRERIARSQMKREAKWTESIAVGSQSFVESLDASVRNRQQVEVMAEDWTWILRECYEVAVSWVSGLTGANRSAAETRRAHPSKQTIAVTIKVVELGDGNSLREKAAGQRCQERAD
jgi:hypothetical protein